MQQIKRYRLLLSLILLASLLFGIASRIGFNQQAQAAVTRDNVSDSGGAVLGGQTSWNHTVLGDNSNRILIVGVTTLYVFGASPPTRVTYAGQNLTSGGSSNCAAGVICNASMWYLLNPPVGTYPILVNSSAAAIEGGAVSYYNVNTDSPLSKTTTTNGTTGSTNYTTSLTVSGTTTSDTLIDVFATGYGCGGTPTITAGSGQSQAWMTTDNTGSNCLVTAGSSKPGGAGGTTFNWTIKRSGSESLTWGGIAAVLNQAVAPTPTLPSGGSNTINGYVYLDTNKNGTFDTGEAGYQGATVRMTNQSTGATTDLPTDSSGHYTVSVGTGTFCMSLPTLPTGYTATSTQTAPCDIITGSNNVLSHQFGIIGSTTYTISGNIFQDDNANGIKDNSEGNYQSTPTITITPNAGTIATKPDGSYTITNLPAGTYVVSYNSLPTGYHMTSPLNGPPPSFQVTVGQNCTTNGASDASCQ